MQRLQRIVKVTRPAQCPDHNQPRMACRPLDIGIDRHRVPQRHKAGEPPAQRLLAPRLNGGCDRRKLRVRRREEQHVPRRLAEIDRLVAVADRSLLGKQEMHGSASRCLDVLDDGAEIPFMQADHDKPRLALFS